MRFGRGVYNLAGRRPGLDYRSNRMYIAKVAFGTNTGLEAPAEAYPAPALLETNYPNPFKNQTTIAYTLSEAGLVRLAVYDVLGREVAVLAKGVQAPGRHLAPFDAAGLPGGVYLYRVEADGYVTTRTMALIK